MTNENVKTQVINDVIVAMSAYIAADLIQILERVIVDKTIDVVMERINTLPAEIKDSVDQQNEYIIKLFLYKKKKLREGTKYGYMASIKRLITVLDKPLVQMDEHDIFYYLNWYENRNVPVTGRKNQNSTLNSERRYLSAFFSWMRKEKLITEVLRSTGARVGEIVEVTVDQINWETGDILILGEKSNRYRTIYLDPDALYHYKKYWNSRTDNNEHMFVSKSKPYKPIGTSSVRTIMKEIAEHAGVTNRCYPHKMRKTLGMELKNRGVDIGTIQEVLGHADSKVTSMYYAQSTPDTLRMIRKRAV